MGSFTLNDKQPSGRCEHPLLWIWIVRDRLGLTGTKSGCGTGLCGA